MTKSASASSTKSTGILEDFKTTPVPKQHKVGGLRIGLLYAAQAFAIPGLVGGVQIGTAFGLKGAISIFIIGGLFLTILGSITGFIGAKTSLSSYMLIKFPFGEAGSKIVNLAFAVSQFGWFGLQVYLFSQAAQGLGQDVFGVEISRSVYIFFGGALMTITTMFGFSVLNRLAMFLVPVMITVLAMMLHGALSSNDLNVLLEIPGTNTLTFSQGIAAVVGSFILGAILISDVTRFSRNWQAAILASVLTFLLAGTYVYLITATAAVATGELDTISVMVNMGIGISAFLLVIFATWTTNSINLYGSSLSISAIFTSASEWRIVVLCGSAGTFAAFLGILEFFIPFLIYLSVIFTPIGGILIVDYFLIRKQKYDLGDLSLRSQVSWQAMLAWLVGSAVSFVTAEEIATISGISAIDALVIPAVFYLVLLKLFPREALPTHEETGT